MKNTGYIQIYTGKGKGKTSAAMGLALRAAGYGMKTYIGQFLKGQKYGELESIKKLNPLISIEQFGRNKFVHVSQNPDKKDIEKANLGLKTCLKAMLSRVYDIIILDEVNVALHFKVLKEKDVIAFLNQKPKNIEVILTGRYAPESILAKADLITEMKEIKHYYSEGIKARKGIER